MIEWVFVFFMWKVFISVIVALIPVVVVVVALCVGVSRALKKTGF